MTIAHLFDHAVRVWRPAVTTGPHRERRATPVVVIEPAGVNARVDGPRSMLADPGPGLTTVGERMVYMDADLDVRARDIIELVSGPNAPARLEVDGPPHRPRGHHLELRCREWAGTLPDLGS